MADSHAAGGSLYLVFGEKLQQYAHSHAAVIGFYLHSLTGMVFFLSGLLQFVKPFRRRYPQVHRFLGYVYYLMVMITGPGIGLILLGGAMAAESAVVSTLTFYPIWFWFNMQALQAIIAGDVRRHERFNLRSFNLAFSIVLMRPSVGIIMAFTRSGLSIGEALKTALWWNIVWVVMGTEAYLYFRERARPFPVQFATTSGKVLLHTGDEVVGLVKLPTQLVSLVSLNERTVQLTLQLIQDDAWTLYPGQHATLEVTDSVTGKSVIRPYTIVSTPEDVAHGRIVLVIRLAPNGAMSGLLKAALDLLENNASSKNPINSASPASQFQFSVQLPSDRYDYVPNAYSGILMIAAGTGVTSMINVIRAILANSKDKTRVHLLFINRSDKDVFYRQELEALESQSKGQLRVTHRINGGPLDTSSLRDMLTQLDDGKQGSKPVQVLAGGPPPFLWSLREQCLEGLKMPKTRVYAFGYNDR